MPVTDVKLVSAAWTSAGDASPLYESPASPLDIFDRVECVGRAGFQGIGFLDVDLRVALERHGAGAMRKVREAVSRAGMEMVELEYLTGWYSTDPVERKASEEKLEFLLSCAAELGARHIKVGTSIAALQTHPPDYDQIAAEFARICEAAQRVGTKMALELHPWAHTCTPELGLGVVRAAPSGSGGLMIDSWQAYRGGWDLSVFEGQSGAHVIAVELADARREPQGTLLEDTVNHRQYCGEGDADIPTFIAAMMSAGFGGFWGIEMLSSEHRATSVEAALKRVRDTTMESFARASSCGS